VSRVGKLPITIPDGVTLKIDGSKVDAKGPKGELSVTVNSDMQLKIDDGVVTVERPSESKEHRSFHGLTRALINNIVEGVTKGFEKRLEIVGVGYRAEVKGKNLLVSAGYSHQILVIPPENVELSTEGKGNNIVIVRGIDKVVVGQLAAKIREIRKPEPYKGKGIRYVGEVVRKKAGKSAA
jgi:large subunit ribosomal protein L6